ncbi:Protein of unknown function (DUF2452) [Aequorivita sublithincola DSM 14238]|uniref:DUF2452 domain-containing protein n=1 Tax=Aequorivita sublithincola (strain DSM 14238 / LMG 21431 / ACAM 643 / 9-3) TaxID=746697 RepID=I3Z060_AEQSU|nr:DUF2452 domain-containing protein [Aequorivita sublithincola]AFL82628.1 Protein of unknown function (DUF2452) [Aequorivita sublithincola DSM 14238]
MTDEKKPDNVVFNIENNRYDAALKPYPTSLGSPVITISDTTAWKNRSINKTNHKVNAKYLELKAEYEKMIMEFEYNNLIFNSEFSFEPVIGEIYHLYKRKEGKSFLSLIAPGQCNFKHIGSFYLNVDQTWEKVNEL